MINHWLTEQICLHKMLLCMGKMLIKVSWWKILSVIRAYINLIYMYLCLNHVIKSRVWFCMYIIFNIFQVHFCCIKYVIVILYICFFIKLLSIILCNNQTYKFSNKPPSVAVISQTSYIYVNLRKHSAHNRL